MLTERERDGVTSHGERSGAAQPVEGCLPGTTAPLTRRRALEALDGLAKELLIAAGTEELVSRTGDPLAAVLGAGKARA